MTYHNPRGSETDFVPDIWVILIDFFLAKLRDDRLNESPDHYSNVMYWQRIGQFWWHICMLEMSMLVLVCLMPSKIPRIRKMHSLMTPKKACEYEKSCVFLDTDDTVKVLVLAKATWMLHICASCKFVYIAFKFQSKMVPVSFDMSKTGSWVQSL